MGLLKLRIKLMKSAMIYVLFVLITALLELATSTLRFIEMLVPQLSVFVFELSIHFFLIFVLFSNFPTGAPHSHITGNEVQVGSCTAII